MDRHPPRAEAPDAELIRRTAAGDREAFAVLYRRHRSAVYRFARLMTGSAAAAEDVVQEVFLVLMRDAARYQPDRASLSTYLYGVARYHTRRRLSRERRFVSLDWNHQGTASGRCDGPGTARSLSGGPGEADEPSTDGDVAEALARRGELQQLRRIILTLPSRYREVVVLCDLQDVSYNDAAQMLGCAVGTVRSRLHRARRLLADRMQRACSRDPLSTRSSLRCPA